MYYLMFKLKEFLKAKLIKFITIFWKLCRIYFGEKDSTICFDFFVCVIVILISLEQILYVFYTWILHKNLFIFCSTDYFRNIKCTPARIEDEIQASNHSLDDGPNFALQQPYFLQCTIREARHQILIMHSLFNRAVIPERQERVSHMVDSNQMMYVLSSLEPYDG